MFHDLKKLLDLLARNGLTIPKYVRQAQDLSPFAGKMRYPNRDAPVRQRQYRRALRIATAVVQWAERQILGRGNPTKGGQVMALHPRFPDDPHAVLDPGIRWFPADEALREKRADQLMPPLVSMLRKEVKAWRERGYDGAADTSKSLLRWWFAEQHLTPVAYAPGSPMQEFQYYFAQREALETIVYLVDVVGLL